MSPTVELPLGFVAVIFVLPTKLPLQVKPREKELRPAVPFSESVLAEILPRSFVTVLFVVQPASFIEPYETARLYAGPREVMLERKYCPVGIFPAVISPVLINWNFDVPTR
jgi:hypothetical protein